MNPVGAQWSKGKGARGLRGRKNKAPGALGHSRRSVNGHSGEFAGLVFSSPFVAACDSLCAHLPRPVPAERVGRTPEGLSDGTTG